jgi:ABC-type antimicrobial peptide transport system permease subunit
MFKSYLKIAWRNLFRSKSYSAINIGGLAMGMAVAILIGLWIYDELSFNKYHNNYHRIARVMQHTTKDGRTGTGMHMPFPLGPQLMESFENDFQYVVMSSFPSGHILSNNGLHFNERGNYMHPDAPEMLTLEMLKGTRSGLIELNSIMLSESLAGKIFGEDDPINKTVTIDNAKEVKVTGVYKDLPKNSEFHEVAFIAPWDLYITSNEWINRFIDSWDHHNVQVFVQLTPQAEEETVSRKIQNTIYERESDQFKVFKRKIFLHPMSKWHLYEEFVNGINAGGRIQFVWLFGGIGVFILLLACINFMNLSTARSEKRAKEVGIRKAIGSFRSQLINQFFSESLLVVALAFIICLGIVVTVLPWFNEISDKRVSIPWQNLYFWASCLGFTLLTGIIAGSYPALYLSSFHAVKVLKGTFHAGRFASIPRQVLVVLQFTVSVALIVGTIVVYRQVQHTKDRPIGFDRDRLIYLETRTPQIHEHFETVRNRLIVSGAIVEMTESNNSVVTAGPNVVGFDWKDKDPAFREQFIVEWITPTYGGTVGWKITDGRDFSLEAISDQSGLIINESAVDYMGLKSPVGEIVKWEGRNWTILGVVKDMITESPYRPTTPTIYMPLTGTGMVSFKLNPDQSTQAAIDQIQSVFKEFAPDVPFDYKFVDEQYAYKFSNEVRIGQLASIFATLAILISCLGLFGMASFVAEQRTKEMGIRKVLGASMVDLWQMLSRDFVVLVVISCVIAVPVSLYFMNDWLQGYEYRTEISAWIFVTASSGALLITLLIVSFQTLKAAITNPVKSLRSE